MPYCSAFGCEVRKVGDGVGFCSTAEKFFKEKLKPGEQMCCTGEKVVKMALGPNQRLVCGQRMFWVLENVKPEDDACCVSEGYKNEDWKAELLKVPGKDFEYVQGKPCVVFRNRDRFRNERVGCTATTAVFSAIGPGYDLACNNTGCFRTELDPGEKFACPRFKALMNIPTSENSNPTLHLFEGSEIETVVARANCAVP